MKHIIRTKSAPAPVGPYSQAIRVGHIVYMAGQIALNPATDEIVGGDMAAQARQVFQNLRNVAEAAGGSLAQVVKVTLYLTDLKQYGAVNAVMVEFFPEPWPIRTTVEVTALPRGSLVEADAEMFLST